MALTEKNTTLTMVDDNGNEVILYPKTKVNCITDLESAIEIGIHTDGLLYLFVNGSPVGNGIDIKGGDVVGYVDENNNIILTGELADGKYTLMYEDADGNRTVIGVLDNTNTPAYINQIPLSINADGTLYNGGQGWKADTRLNSSGAEAEKTGMEVTGFIPAKYGDILRMRNVTFNYFTSNTNRDQNYLTFYDSNFAFLGYRKTHSSTIDTGTVDLVINDLTQSNTGLAEYTGSNAANVAYIRISSSEISNDSIITINQEITD